MLLKILGKIFHFIYGSFMLPGLSFILVNLLTSFSWLVTSFHHSLLIHLSSTYPSMPAFLSYPIFLFLSFSPPSFPSSPSFPFFIPLHLTFQSNLLFCPSFSPYLLPTHDMLSPLMTCSYLTLQQSIVQINPSIHHLYFSLHSSSSVQKLYQRFT